MLAPLALVLAALPAAFASNQYNVSVGADKMLVYDPPYVMAEAGDIIQFTFHPKTHSVTQSSFDSPCTPLKDGRDSGLVGPVAAETDDLPMMYFKVQDTDPIWVYCRQPGPPNHCSEGMVFAVNPGPEGSANSFSAFREKAKSTGMVMNPSPVVDNGPPTLMPVPVMPGPGDDVTSGTTYTGSGYAYSD